VIALNKVDLPTFGSPTIPAVKAIHFTPQKDLFLNKK
jgi:hypothetical protein